MLLIFILGPPCLCCYAIAVTVPHYVTTTIYIITTIYIYILYIYVFMFCILDITSRKYGDFIKSRAAY